MTPSASHEFPCVPVRVCTSFDRTVSKLTRSARSTVPAEVLAAALAEDGSRRSWPGAVPDYCFTADGRRMLYDVKRISFCPTRYWPTVAVASSRGGALEYRASLDRTEYEAAASALDARTAAWYIRTGTAVPVGAPKAVDILASFPPLRGLVFGSTACGGSREVGVLLAQAASSSAQRQWRSLSPGLDNSTGNSTAT